MWSQYLKVFIAKHSGSTQHANRATWWYGNMVVLVAVWGQNCDYMELISLISMDSSWIKCRE